MAFIYDKSQEFEKKVNSESVVWQNVETDYWKENLKNLIKEHYGETGSLLSKEIIENYDNEINNFNSFKIILSHFLFDKLWSPFFTMINFFFAFGNSFKTFLE